MKNPRILAPSAALLLLALLAGPALLAAQDREDNAAALIGQGDRYYGVGNYKLAIGTYLEAAAMSRSRLNLSAAYFGLSLCYFYERDTANAVKWLEKTLEVEPNKEISEQFYPQAFVDLFRQAREETRRKSPATTETRETSLPPTPPKNDTARVATREKPASRRPAAEEPRLDPDGGETGLGGRFEIAAHYSSWSVDPIISIFESGLRDKLAEELENRIIKKIGEAHAGLVTALFTPQLDLDSSGSNYGLGLRYYARGWAGTFSFGISVEKTNMTLGLSGRAKQTFVNGTWAEVTAEASIDTAPLAAHFSFQWDLGRGIIRPFLGIGFGLAALDGTFRYAYTGTYSFGTLQDSISDDKTETFAELSEDIDFEIPKILLLVQIDVGVKVQIVKGFSLTAEAGFWDGLMLRGGLAYRF